MKILALILARGKSKRLPGKNIKILGGKPLINWSINAAKSINEICEIMVSTDDKKIKSIAEEAGAYAPWLRPAELSSDTVSSVDASLHALNWYEKNHGEVDGLLLLQPTSPFRTKKTIKRGIRLFSDFNLCSVLGVSRTHDHPKWTFKINNGALIPFIAEHGLTTRSQDLESAYVVNGSLYLITPSNLRENKSFFLKNTLPLLIESEIESIDIDTESDWEYAEFCLNKFQNYKSL
jgi:N-acylneuraminate cytidylyltransferase